MTLLTDHYLRRLVRAGSITRGQSSHLPYGLEVPNAERVDTYEFTWLLCFDVMDLASRRILRARPGRSPADFALQTSKTSRRAVRVATPNRRSARYTIVGKTTAPSARS